MTDNEIIKSLNESICPNGISVYLVNKKSISTVLTLADIIDLINRLQAENERLKGIKTTDWLVKGISAEQLESEKIQALKGEIEWLEKENENLRDSVVKKKFKDELFEMTLGEYKAEAYKEFAERLKEKTLYSVIDSEYNCVYVSEIDNLLKELVGEDK